MHIKADYSRASRAPRPLAEVDHSFFYIRACILAIPLLFAWLWCAGNVSAEVYEVGPGKPYARIIDCPTHNLMAGDSILVYYKSEPYKEKFLLHGVGTAEQPITLRGVPDASGNKPVIDGEDAVSSLAVDYWNEDRQIIKIGQYTSHLSDYIIVDGFVFRNADNNHSFINDQGVSSSYLRNACAVRSEYANHVVIGNCETTNAGYGFQIGATDIGAIETFDLRKTEPMKAVAHLHDTIQDDDDPAASPGGFSIGRVATLMERDPVFDHASSVSPGGGYDSGFFSRLASTILDGDLTLMESAATIKNVAIRGTLELQGSAISINLTLD